MSKRKPIYMIVMNLAGLHNKIYELHWDKETELYWDKDGGWESDGKDTTEDGISNLVFKNKHDAQCALRGARMVVESLRRLLA